MAVTLSHEIPRDALLARQCPRPVFPEAERMTATQSSQMNRSFERQGMPHASSATMNSTLGGDIDGIVSKLSGHHNRPVGQRDDASTPELAETPLAEPHNISRSHDGQAQTADTIEQTPQELSTQAQTSQAHIVQVRTPERETPAAWTPPIRPSAGQTSATQMPAGQTPRAQTPTAQTTALQMHEDTHQPGTIVSPFLGLVVPIPGLRAKSIFMNARVESPEFSESEYNKRFGFLSDILEDAINLCPGLRDEIRLRRTTHYTLHMVGESQETAKPTIVVYCITEYFKRLKAVFDQIIQKFCQPKNRWRLYKKNTYFPDAQLRVATLALVYYCTPTSSIRRKASDVVLLAHFDTDITWCGGIVEYGSRTASLGLTVAAGDQVLGTLTVDHLFPNKSAHGDEDLWIERSQDDENETTSCLYQVDYEELTFRSECFDLGTRYDLELQEDASVVLHNGKSIQQPYEGDLWVDSNDEYDFDQDEGSVGGDGSEAQDVSEQAWARSFHSPSATVPPGKAEWECVRPSRQLYRGAPYMDWAITRPKQSGNRQAAQARPYRQNVVFPNGRDHQHVVLEKIAKEPRCHLAEVYIVSGIRGILQARLLGSPSMLGSAPGQDLCKVWTVIVDDGMGILDGECGSVVIDQATNEVYGHVVAAGPVGQAFIVPIADVLRQIDDCFDNRGAKLFTGSELETVTKRTGLTSAAVGTLNRSQAGSPPTSRDTKSTPDDQPKKRSVLRELMDVRKRPRHKSHEGASEMSSTETRKDLGSPQPSNFSPPPTAISYGSYGSLPLSNHPATLKTGLVGRIASRMTPKPRQSPPIDPAYGK